MKVILLVSINQKKSLFTFFRVFFFANFCLVWYNVEIAAGFKEQANKLYAAKKYRDAIKFYTQAIEECGKDLPIEERRILWSNRAAANLELGKLLYPSTLSRGVLMCNEF